MRRFRCSSLPLLFACGGSQGTERDEDSGPLMVDTAGEPAAMGSCVHDVLAAMVDKGENKLPPYQPFADSHGVTNLDELGMLAWYGLKAWDELGDYFPNPMTEVPLDCWMQDPDGAKLTGHMDVYQPGNEWSYVLDWKSGRLDSDHYHQMAGYAKLAMGDSNPSKGVKVVVVMLRDQTYRVYSFTRGSLVDWSAKFVSDIIEWDGRFTVGEHCRFCPRSMDCPARTAMVRSTITDIMAPGTPHTELAPCDLLDLYQRAKVVGAAIDQYKEFMRTYVRINGPVEDARGRSLGLHDKSRSSIDARKAWPVVRGYLTDDEMAPAVKIQKTDLMKAVSAKAERGQKGKVKAALMQQLQDAGAVSETTYQELRLTMP